MSGVNMPNQKKTSAVEYAMMGLQGAQMASSIKANNAAAAKDTAAAQGSTPAAEMSGQGGLGEYELSEMQKKQALERRLNQYGPRGNYGS